MSQSKTYPLADPSTVAAKIKAAGGPQLDPTQPTGEASADGVKLGWSIVDGEITVTVLSKPFFVSYGAVWSHVDAVLGGPVVNLTINGKIIKKQTLAILGLLVAGSLASQVSVVNHFLSYHPRLAPVGGFVVAMLTLLHEPAVQKLVFQQSSTQPDGTTIDTKLTAPVAPGGTK